MQFGKKSPKFHRIVLPVQHDDWKLPIQVCRLLQVHLGVPVQHILWGHPNLRDPNRRGKQWAKEHRIRVYAEDFLPVGFHFRFKQEILEEMARWNKREGGAPSRACNPLARHRIKIKKKHKEEASKNLPDELRGKHFNAYFHICRALGCKQGEPSSQLVLLTEE